MIDMRNCAPQHIPSNYCLQKKLGEGQYGTVWLVRDRIPTRNKVIFSFVKFLRNECHCWGLQDGQFCYVGVHFWWEMRFGGETFKELYVVLKFEYR